MAENGVMGSRATNVPCRYFALGKCNAGDSCPFSHQSGLSASSDKSSSKNEAHKRPCVFFQQGNCKYGSSCLFKHQISTSSSSGSSDNSDQSLSHLNSTTASTKSSVDPICPSSQPQSPSSKPITKHSSNTNGSTSGHNTKKTGAKSKRDVLSDSSQASTYSSDCDSDTSKENLSPTDEDTFCISESRLNLDAPEFVPSYLLSATNVETEKNSEGNAAGGTVKSWAQIVSANGSSAVTTAPEVQLDSNGVPLLCPYAEAGHCPYEDTCQYIHGEICEFCGLPCLHPYSEELSKKHTSECIKQHEIDMEHSMAVARSRDKVCGVCFEVIMDKNPISEQRFGILPNCNHCFCLACIRKWRQAKQFDNKIIRACPECRVTSDFVCPSSYWVDTTEDKDKLLNEYRQALSVKQCKYFQQGKGKCPFGNKCFYLHAYPDGTKVDLGPPVARRLQDANGDIIIVDEHVLWDFVLGREGRWLDDLDDDMLEDLLLDAFTRGFD